MAKDKLVLVADDSADEVFIFKRAFSQARVDVPFIFVQNGEEVLDYISGAGEFADRNTYPLPSLLLLDLEMPRMDGFHVLRWLAKQDGLKRMLVVVLTSSDEQRDVDRAYDLGANSYLVKPSTLEGYVSLAGKLCDYWIGLNRSPNCLPGH